MAKALKEFIWALLNFFDFIISKFQSYKCYRSPDDGRLTDIFMLGGVIVVVVAAEAMRSILRLWNKTTPNISQALPGWSLDVDPCDPAQGWGGVGCTGLLANSTNTTRSADTSSEFYVVTNIW
jgi:hypothetical protein